MRLSNNKFQLAVFGCNVSHGCTISSAPGGIAVTWEESLLLARKADALGFEAFIPVCRWKGFGGPSEFNHRTFETFTWAAGLAQATENIHVFATVAVPAIHPVLAAKQAATIDHISGGRFGLNVVAGWNSGEVAMFGKQQLPHAERYQYADEWMQFIFDLWQKHGEFDFSSQYFDAPACYAEPKPLQQPRPPVMSAGVSPAGRAFAAKHADMNFILAPTLEAVSETVNDIHGIARSNYSREVDVWGNAAIFCRPTMQEAEDYYRYVIDEAGDRVPQDRVGLVLRRPLGRLETGLAAEDQPLIDQGPAEVRGDAPGVGDRRGSGRGVGRGGCGGLGSKAPGVVAQGCFSSDGDDGHQHR